MGGAGVSGRLELVWQTASFRAGLIDVVHGEQVVCYIARHDLDALFSTGLHDQLMGVGLCPASHDGLSDLVQALLAEPGQDQPGCLVWLLVVPTHEHDASVDDDADHATREWDLHRRADCMGEGLCLICHDCLSVVDRIRNNNMINQYLQP